MNGPYRQEAFDPGNPVVYQPYAGYRSFHHIRSGLEDEHKDERTHHPGKIRRFDQLPVKIQAIAKQLLQERLQNWADKVTFHSADLYFPEALFKDEVPARLNYGPVPKYQLWFVFSFPEKRIKEYCFEVSFDQYGQVLKFEFSHHFVYLEQTLYQYDQAQKLALEHVKARQYKPDLLNLELKYSSDSGRLNWQFYFLQAETDTPQRTVKTIRVIIVDLVCQLVIYDQRLIAGSSKTRVHIEAGTIVSETIQDGKKVQVVRFTAIEEELLGPEGEDVPPAP